MSSAGREGAVVCSQESDDGHSSYYGAPDGPQGVFQQLSKCLLIYFSLQLCNVGAVAIIATLQRMKTKPGKVRELAQVVGLISSRAGTLFSAVG